MAAEGRVAVRCGVARGQYLLAKGTFLLGEREFAPEDFVLLGGRGGGAGYLYSPERYQFVQLLSKHVRMGCFEMLVL